MFVRSPEEGLIDACGEEGVGIIPFMLFTQGLLTDRYLDGIPADSRASRVEQITENIAAVKNTDFTAEELAKIDKILA
jgi:L-glyceraldehyde 3-phosphate reductase